jgi:hypothetical protein
MPLKQGGGNMKADKVNLRKIGNKIKNIIFRHWQMIVIFVLILIILKIKAPAIVQTSKAIFSVASLLLGGLGGAVVVIFYSNYRTKREYKSLILAFASELILAFERCVLYYKQSLYPVPQISYSTLFDFTDASALSKLATVTKDSAIIEAIIHLKSQYFQVGRHVDEASKFAARAKRFPQERNQLKRAADHAQGTAMAFFLGSDLPKPDPETYNMITEKTSLILTAANKVSSKEIAEKLSSKFARALNLKRKLDDLKQEKREKKINQSEFVDKLDEL